jgi:hypothetical protein
VRYANDASLTSASGFAKNVCHLLKTLAISLGLDIPVELRVQKPLSFKNRGDLLELETIFYETGWGRVGLEYKFGHNRKRRSGAADGLLNHEYTLSSSRNTHGRGERPYPEKICIMSRICSNDLTLRSDRFHLSNCINCESILTRKRAQSASSCMS